MAYAIVKLLTSPSGRKQRILMTNGQSEIYETSDLNIVTKFCEVLNHNTDSGCEYSIIEIGKTIQ
jgi:hypothetical protein